MRPFLTACTIPGEFRFVRNERLWKPGGERTGERFDQRTQEDRGLARASTSEGRRIEDG